MRNHWSWIFALVFLSFGCGGTGSDGPGGTLVDYLAYDGSGDGALDLGALDTLDASKPGGDALPDFSLGDGLDAGTEELGELVDECTQFPMPLGCPCDSNDECVEGFCIEAQFSYVCTGECVEECLDGWECKGTSGFGPDPVFLCVPDLVPLCDPCETDADCGNGGQCVALEGKSFCSFPCSSTSTCQAPFSCQTLEGDGPDFCLPMTGSCSCPPGDADDLRLCERSNDNGTCVGFELCDPEAGWIECTALEPSPEVCDGYDNNCDGVVDEGFAVQEAYIADEHCGGCFNDCSQIISNGDGTCDSLHFDFPRCVVVTCDPGYVQTGPSSCGPVQSGAYCIYCASDNDCAGGTCVELDSQWRCAPPCSESADCPAESDCQTLEGGQSGCLPTSGSCDCNAITQGQMRPCVVENPDGSCSGTQTCDELSGWSECSAPEPTQETCNGADDDCNGLIDDALDSGGPCIVSEGSSCVGALECQGDAGWVCVGQEPQAESCDYVDNDCDGLADNGFVDDNGLYVGLENCGACGLSCVGLFEHATSICGVSNGASVCRVDVCDPGFLRLNDFQCVQDLSSLCQPCAGNEDCLLTQGVCVGEEGFRFCSRSCQSNEDCPTRYQCDEITGTSACQPLSGSCLCSAESAGLIVGCTLTSPQSLLCQGIQSCLESGWSQCLVPAEICDGTDNDCDGIVDEDFLQDGEYASNENCGACGVNCAHLGGTHVSGVCDAQAQPPECVLSCETGYVDVNGSPLDGCECRILSSTDLPDGIDQNCDGIDGDPELAIFVSASGSDQNPGTVELPVQTIQYGLELAHQTQREYVLVAAGNYPESVVMISGVKLLGGFSPGFVARNIATYHTILLGAPPSQERPGTLTCRDLQGDPGATVVDGLVIYGPQNLIQGASSYAVVISNCGDELTLSRNQIVSGDGGAGAPGAAGASGTAGVDGTPGHLASEVSTPTCEIDLLAQGGPGGIQICAAVDASGGAGGTGACPSFEQPPQAVEQGLAGQGAAGGIGGGAGWDGKIHHPSCKMCNLPTGGELVDGQDGGNGGAGQAGTAGSRCVSSMGAVVSGLWAGGGGGDGSEGSPGSGGGGGFGGVGAPGGGGGVDGWCSYGGGSGGEGGPGGSGGGGGGGCGGISFCFYVSGAGGTDLSAWKAPFNGCVQGLGGLGGLGGVSGASSGLPGLSGQAGAFNF